MINPVILAGGSGTRLWPLSRETYPKVLLPLASEYSLMQDTVKRAAIVKDSMQPIVVCNQSYRFLVASQLQSLNIKPQALILEPCSRNTAPAISMAALHVAQRDLDELLLVLPADHTIEDKAAFSALVNVAKPLAQEGKLVMFGIVADSPATGYGYIEHSASSSQTYSRVKSFIEKPDKEIAKRLFSSGNYYWNSGIFLFSAKSYLSALEAYATEIYNCCVDAYHDRIHDLDFIRIGKEAFERCPSNSIDYAIMEKNLDAVVVPLDTHWSDIGSWDALHQRSQKDENNNALIGDVITKEVKNSYIQAQSRLVVAMGIENMMVVETDDAILVGDISKAQQVKHVVEHLKQQERTELLTHKKVHRPWGSYETLIMGDRFLVKKLLIEPGKRMSLQLHHHRSEHWVIVNGTAKVECEEINKMVAENESFYIPIGARHRIENPGKVPLEIIEIQVGSYLKEDDIVRFSDDFNR